MIKASVIGWPIAHSRSPLIHAHWLKILGIAGRYEKLAVTPDDLGTFMQSLRSGEHVGTNVTLPHKEAALGLVDEADETARRIGSLNTVWRENGKLFATSTDGYGFVSNVNHVVTGFDWKARVITLLGAGGSARAIADACLVQGAERVWICNRTPARAEALAKDFPKRVKAVETAALADVLPSTDVLVNTTSAGMQGGFGFEIPWNALKPEAVVADIVYTPLVTEFLASAKLRGHAVVPGLGMLLHQAVPGFERWFGRTPTVTSELYDLVARDIDPGYVR
jgi:shikimate dehydrogenase